MSIGQKFTNLREKFESLKNQVNNFQSELKQLENEHEENKKFNDKNKTNISNLTFLGSGQVVEKSCDNCGYDNFLCETIIGKCQNYNKWITIPKSNIDLESKNYIKCEAIDCINYRENKEHYECCLLSQNSEKCENYKTKQMTVKEQFEESLKDWKNVKRQTYGQIDYMLKVKLAEEYIKELENKIKDLK